MQRPLSTAISLGLAAMLIAGCGGAVPSPSPQPPDTTPGPAFGYLLRATQVQAIGPQERFGWMPLVAITDALEVVVSGPVPAIYPGPLLPNLQARPITAAGYRTVVQAARDLGLLDPAAVLLPPDAAPGAALGRLEIVADGVRFDLTGDPSRLGRCGEQRCIPEPGTPEAFAALWQQLGDMSSWLGSELGPERPFSAPAYAILAGPPIPAEAPFEPEVSAWPVRPPLAALGRPIGTDILPRCGTVRGEAAAALYPALAAANQLTRWSDAPGDAGAQTFSIQVRPLLAGEDACREMFGLAT